MHKKAAAFRRHPEFRWLLQAQMLATIAISVLAALTSGSEAAQSALLGGLVCLGPALYFAWRLRTVRGGRQARRFVTHLYRAEAGKFGLTVVLFVAVFVTVPPSNPIFFFSAYVATQSMHWLAPWLMHVKSTPRT